MERETTAFAKLNPKQSLYFSNEFAFAKQALSLNETKLIRIVIAQILKDDKDLWEYSIRIQELARLLDIDPSNIYRNIYETCLSLVRQTIEIRSMDLSDRWEILNFINKADYDNKTGKITLKISEQMKPYLIGLNERYTKYTLENILKMTSIYSLRLYEIIKSIEFQGKQEYTFEIKLLRKAFNCENTFTSIADFKRYVIEKAVNGINDNTDIYIDNYSLEKTGRKFTHVKFIIEKGNGYSLRRKGYLSAVE